MDAFAIICSFCKQEFPREQGRFVFEGDVYICEACLVAGVQKLGVDRVFAGIFEAVPDFQDATVGDALRDLFGDVRHDSEDVELGAFLDRLRKKMPEYADLIMRRKKLEEDAERLERELRELEAKQRELVASQTERATALRDLRRRIENLQP